MGIAALAVALFVGIFAQGLARPLVRRIGLRNALRRPREAALVMLGCILGTALIVGNLSVGDSFTASMRDQTLDDIGNLDVIVNYDNRDDWAAGNARLTSAPIPGVVTTTAVATMTAPITANNDRDVSPRAKIVEADYSRAGDLAAAPGVPLGSGPEKGQVWVSQIAAKALNLRVGTDVVIQSKTKVNLRVSRIVDNALSSFLQGQIRFGETFLVPPGTVESIRSADPTRVTPDWRTLIIADQPHTAEVPSVAATDALRRSLTRLVTPHNGDVDMARFNRLNGAIKQGATTGAFLTQIGTFGIIAGVLLLVNVLLMLAEERLAELGTMRAVGMARSPLIGSFSLEGAIYALVGALLGGGLGLALGRVLVLFMNENTNNTSTGLRGLPLHFSVKPMTIVTGVSLGFVVAALAVIATSYRVSRLEVIRALRNLPPTPRARRQTAVPFMVMGVLAGAAMSVLGYTAPDPMLLLIGPVVLCASIGGLVNRRFGFDAAMIVANTPLLVFSISYNPLNQADQTGPGNSVLAGVVTVASGVFLLNTLQGRLAAGLRRIGRGRKALPTRLGLANPIAHRVRMLLTVTPFALVVFTLTYAEGLSNLISTELRQTSPVFTGDYNVFADSSATNPFDFSKLREPDVSHVARTGSVIGQWSYAVDRPTKFWPVTGFNKDLLEASPPKLIARAPEFATDKEAFEAVLENPDLIIVDSIFLFNGNLGTGAEDPDRNPRVGDTYTMVNPVTNQGRDVRVAAIKYQDVFQQGPLYGFEGLKSLFGERLVLTDAFLVHESENHQPLIDRLQRLGVANGLQVRDIEATSDAFFSSINGLINLFRSDLGIGIIVGVAGIGVVLVRSVRDRRRTIGTLRAMGFDAGEIGRSFIVEGAFVAIQGLVVGVGFGYCTVLALKESKLIKSLLGFEPSLHAPPITVLYITVGLFVAAVLASLIPARSASKIPPAVALRLVD